MSLVFKPEDFYGLNLTFNPEGGDYGYLADAANAKFQGWMSQCDVVYGTKDSWINFDSRLHFNRTDTHQARIFDIKEIETECSHDPKWMREGWVGNKFYPGFYTCKDCNKKLKPTGWELV